VQTYGFPKIVEALKMYGKGKETPEVLRTITGKPITQLDAEFHKYLEVRLAAYAGTFKLPTRGFDDVSKLEIAADAAPRDAKAKANVALGYYYGGDADKANAAANAAIAMDPKQPIARYILAEIAVHKQDLPTAKQLITGLIAEGIDNSDLRARLAQIAENENNFAEQEKQLCAAKKLDPERSYVYQELSELYAKRGDQAKSLTELEHYVFLEQMEAAPLKKLVTEYTKSSSWPKVKTFGEMAVYITPQDPDILQSLARAYLELGDPSQSLFTLDTMLLLQPEPRRPALVHIARAKAFVALKKKTEAKAALALALKTEPTNYEALQLQQQIK
jgi:tetratricopeptide (TPR) repeat protein